MISKEEHEEIGKYINKIESREVFSLEEYENFKTLCQKMSEEVPRDKREDFDWAVSGLLGSITGAMIGDVISKALSKAGIRAR